MATIKKIPNTEKLKVTAKNKAGETYLITQSLTNNLFYLYKKEAGGLTKLDKGRQNPLEFNDIIGMHR